MLLAGVGAMILPTATTYTRKWIKPAATGMWVLNPDYIDEPYGIVFTCAKSNFKVLQSCIINRKTKTPINPVSSPTYNVEEESVLIKHVLYPVRFNQDGVYVPPLIPKTILCS